MPYRKVSSWALKPQHMQWNQPCYNFVVIRIYGFASPEWRLRNSGEKRGGKREKGWTR